MRREDIVQVTEIDREAFSTQWPPPNYNHELQNRLAHYIVAGDEAEKVKEPDVKAISPKGFLGLIYRLKQFFSHDRSSGGQSILGFAGFWILVDEAHIISIAVREEYCRQGIGELLLMSLIELAAELSVRVVTLEVRISNTAARKLYSKYGFTQAGLRRGYYTDNREDGMSMSLEGINSAPVRANLQQLKQAHAQKWGLASSQIAR